MSHGSNLGGTIPLSAMHLNQQASIIQVLGEESARHRVEEMGLRPGAVIRMLRTHPPQIIALHGRRLCLRTNTQLEVLVSPLETETPAGNSA